MPTAKICGLTTEASLDAAIAHGASHVGFVFFPRSPRDIDPDRAAALIARTPPRVAKVGVFVDPDDALLTRAVAAGVDTIQLHGSETPERVAAVRARYALPVWRAVAVRTREDLGAAAKYRGAADLILYDAKPPRGADLPGGLGLRFDWRLLQGHVHPLPWALSGGLDAASVGEAVQVTGATLLDVSSGVELSPGVKDVDKIAAFLQSVARS
ncbi:phosphoribosylanthranilate isomerase [Sphingomonas prati]|uniref:N-(5'-phosphoribosyl)anthranilate isomerase n=1 Tax=Sphingomonas prati TaxID=1843237 RepID=A0A7W9F0J7_9SPHN|nr:phosphoribosylanthranilate isomerase [Sphingomonas prati]MBB5728416.1 phosphoribosylanthranilate isomerase [Sphingomonas prati]GGE73972.1 N-(5'-phosphoribosyl)anthranilate isomerase [Sphingomonas prati]